MICEERSDVAIPETKLICEERSDEAIPETKLICEERSDEAIPIMERLTGLLRQAAA